jgi:carboxyl-terminal processing protease
MSDKLRDPQDIYRSSKLNNFLSKDVSMKNVITVLFTFVVILSIVFMYFTANGALLINGNGTYYDSTISQINALYKQNYIGDMSVFKGNTLTDNAIAAYVASIGDKYAAYLTPEEFKEFQIKSSDNAVGIGVEIVSTPDNKKLLVTSVYANSPAEAAGLKVGDYLTSVNGKKYTDLGMQKFLKEDVY